MKRNHCFARIFVLIPLFLLTCFVARQGDAAPMPAGADYIEGVVASANGPEAGVWVIAETKDLPTKFAKVVVTDDHGRYMLPQMPDATYSVWVRGYGLVDSKHVTAKPGQKLNLTAVIAPDGKTAALVYPANYWLSLLRVPPGKLSIDDAAGSVKECLVCHQIGDVATRTLPPATMKLGNFASSLEAWDRRTKSGPIGANMSANYYKIGDQRKMFADWTDRIAAGDYPTEAPPRPKGIERNVVLTLWDWGTANSYMHDEAASDLRNPTVNANGNVYGVVASSNIIAVLDPNKNTASQVEIPTKAEPAGSMNMPSPYWGDENIWFSTA
ncbi:MAG: carboxypeptidase-like regulatory domain-containing protein, partial [Candidatus Acidiferrales bacterium]